MIFSDLSRPITESGSDGSKRRQAYNKLMHDLNQELSGTSVKSKLTPINKKIEDLETKTMTTDKEDWFNNPKDHSRLAVFTVSGVKDDNEDTNADDLYNAFDKLDYEGFYFFLKTDDEDNVTLIGLYDGSDDLNESAVESFKEFTAIDEANMQQLNLYLTQGDMYPAFAQSYYNQVAAASYALAPFVPSFNLPEYINLKAIQRYGVMTADIYLRRIGSLRYNNGKHPFKEFTMVNVQSQNFIKIVSKLLNNTKSIDKRYLKMYQYNFQNKHYRFSMVFAALIKEKKPKVLSLWYIDEKCELETIRIGAHDLVESVESLQEAEVGMEDYMLNGDKYITWAQTQYNHLAVSDPKMIMYVPAFDIPEKLKIKTLEDVVDRYCKFNFLKGHGMPDFTLAYFQIIDFNDAYKYAIDKAYHHIKPRERFSYGLYQYNFRRQNRKYSIIILATNVKVYGVWALNSNRALVEIPLSGIKLLESDIEDSEVITETKRSELPDSAFGIPEDRKFPLDTEQHVRSAIKLFGHAEESKKKELAKRIASAAKKYDIEIPETTQVYKYLHEDAVSEEELEYLNETKRSNLPDSAFGIPEDRKFPLDTEQHVRSAIRLFGHAESSKKKSLAKKISRAASKYGIKIPETTQVYKYAHESAIDEFSVVEQLYHVSKDANQKILKPSIPLNFLTKNGYEDNTTKRVCFSTSIEGCLTALSANIKDQDFYVYTPSKAYKTFKPSKSQVPDVDITDEVWIKEPVEIECIGKIHVSHSTGEGLSYTYGNQTAVLYFWAYKWVDKFNESTEDLDLPDEKDNNLVDLKTLLDNTDPKKVYLTSDWHFFKNHYKHEANYVNTRDILTWCRQNIKDDDVFFYMGDICYKYANTTDKKESQKLMASIPGIKVLLLGNHDIMLGEDYYSACGFKYVIETLEWDKYVFTHKPIDMTPYNEDIWNIHAHIHTDRTYNTSDGSRNVNIYPYFNDNKPYTLDYVMNHKEQMAKENHRSEWVNMGETYNFKTNSIKNLEAIYESMRKDDIASTVFYSPDITSNSIAYMLSPFQDRLKGHIGVTIDVSGCYDNTNISPRLMSATMKSTRGNFIYSSEVHENDSCRNVINAAGYTNVAEVDQLDSTGELTISVPNMNKISRADPGMMIHKGVHLSTIDIGERSNRYDSVIVVTHIKNDQHGYYGAIENVARSFTSKNGGDKIYLNDGDPFTLMERITEATSAIQDYYEDNIIYINILQNMNAGRMPNIGILVSDDIVAVEQATIDFIRNCKSNKEFMENIGKHGSYHMIEYAEWLNMGTTKYKLYDVNNNRLRLEATYFDETKRSELPDSAFGIPEDRKFPLDTEQHVRSAIKLFGHAEESKKKELAKRIKAAASQYGIDIPETTQVYKYLHEAADTILPADVKNIVFDLGGVLIDDRSLEAIKEDPAFPKEYQEELYDLVVKQMFDTKTHKYLHTCDVDEAADYIISNVPKHLRVYIKPLMNCLSKALYKFDYTDELIDMLKENGYKVYYLSNWAYYSCKMSENFFAPFLDKFDGGLFSHEVDIEKPDLAIYNAFCQIFNVTPVECAFFDDREENVEAARKAGWNAYEFDPESTPMELMGTYDIVFEDLNDLFMAETDYGVKNISIDDIKRWYVSDIKLDKGMNEDMYATRLEDAIAHGKRNGVDTYYVYTCNYTTGMVDVYKIIPLGKIKVHEDNTYEWLIQYPVMLRNGRLTSCLEWAMASMNPIIGIKKPFVLKMGSDCGGTIDSTQYAFSPDIISDKFLVVNEEAHLEIVDSSFFDDRFVEEYEYVGNSYNIRKIAEAYNHQYIVDDSIFYTALSGKNMLSEDQIDFDKSFRKIDFELMKEKQFSEAATLRDSIMKAMGYRTPNIPIEEQFVMKNVPFMHKYNKNNDFSIREDYEGYYFYNSLNGKRSGSVATSDMLSEAMLKSIL